VFITRLAYWRRPLHFRALSGESSPPYLKAGYQGGGSYERRASVVRGACRYRSMNRSVGPLGPVTRPLDLRHRWGNLGSLYKLLFAQRTSTQPAAACLPLGRRWKRCVLSGEASAKSPARRFAQTTSNTGAGTNRAQERWRPLGHLYRRESVTGL